MPAGAAAAAAGGPPHSQALPNTRLPRTRLRTRTARNYGETQIFNNPHPQDTMAEMATDIKAKRTGEVSASADELFQFINKVGASRTCTACWD